MVIFHGLASMCTKKRTIDTSKTSLSISCFQPGVCNPSVLRSLPTEKVPTGTSLPLQEGRLYLHMKCYLMCSRALIVCNHLFVALWAWAGWKQICRRGYDRPVPTPPLSTSTRACRTSRHISMHTHTRHTDTHTYIHICLSCGYTWEGKTNFIYAFFFLLLLCVLLNLLFDCMELLKVWQWRALIVWKEDSLKGKQNTLRMKITDSSICT